MQKNKVGADWHFASTINACLRRSSTYAFKCSSVIYVQTAGQFTMHAANTAVLVEADTRLGSAAAAHLDNNDEQPPQIMFPPPPREL